MTFSIAFLVRTYVSAPLVSFLAPRFIEKRFHGFMRGAASTALSVLTTTPITGAITAALFADPSDFLRSYASALATTLPITMVVNHFIVGPLVKMLFNNRISPAGGLNALKHLQQHANSLLRMFGM